MRRLLRGGAQPRMLVRGATALHVAARCGRDRCLRTLLAACDAAAIDDRGRDRKTPLISACAAGHGSTAALLLRSGARTDCADFDGMTATMHAVRGGAAALHAMVNHGALCGADRGGDTALHHAARCDCERSVRRIVASRDGVLLLMWRNRRGCNPLEVAAAADCPRAVAALLHAHGVSGISYGWPMHIAATNNACGAMKALCQCDVAALACFGGDDDDGVTPLHNAARADATTCVEMLLAMSTVDIDARDDCGRTPLLVAVRAVRAGTVSLLLHHGADSMLPDLHGLCPLQAAAACPLALHLLRRIISESRGGADALDEMRAVDERRGHWQWRAGAARPAAIVAALAGNTAHVALLIDAGFSMDGVLHSACCAGRPQIARLALERCNTSEPCVDHAIRAALSATHGSAIVPVMYSMRRISAANVCWLLEWGATHDSCTWLIDAMCRYAGGTGATLQRQALGTARRSVFPQGLYSRSAAILELMWCGFDTLRCTPSPADSARHILEKHRRRRSAVTARQRLALLRAALDTDLGLYPLAESIAEQLPPPCAVDVYNRAVAVPPDCTARRCRHILAPDLDTVHFNLCAPTTASQYDTISSQQDW